MSGGIIPTHGGGLYGHLPGLPLPTAPSAPSAPSTPAQPQAALPTDAPTMTFGNNGVLQTPPPGWTTPTAPPGTAAPGPPSMSYGQNGSLYEQPAGTPAAASPTAATPSSSVLPSPSSITGTAPAPIQAFGPLGYVAPTTVSPYDQQGYLNQYSQMIQDAMTPYNLQQQQQLQGDLASRGIQNSGSGSYLMGNLLSQQQANLAGQIAPFVSQAFGYTQNDLLANQQAGNAASELNASTYNNALGQNYGAYNSYLSNLFGAGANLSNTELGSYLGSYGPNSAVTGAMSQTPGLQQGAYWNAASASAQQQQQLGQLAAMAFMSGGA